MKKHILLLVFLLLIQFKGFSQKGNNDYITELTPPSPISEDLGRYGNTSVGLFTGSPDINISIYNFKSGNIDIPIRATYSSNGVKVDETAKQLGLSWNLVTGGLITRTVRKAPDEKSTFLNLGDYPNALSCKNNNNNPELGSTKRDNIDTEKDIYTFNIPNVSSGKFFFENKKIILLEPSDIKIETFVTKDSPNTKGFKVTNTDGVEYYFGEYIASIENVRQRTSAQTLPSSVNTAWYLTRIKSVNKNEIVFTYSIKGFNYISSYSQTATGKIYEGRMNISADIPIPHYENSGVPYLTTIHDNKGNKLEFSYETFKIPAQERNNESSQLVKIDVKNINSVLKSFDFKYDLVPVSTVANNDYTKLDDKRIFLKNINELSSTGELIKQYSFEYYSPEKLPARHSFAKDLYGYYNDANNRDLIYNNVSTNNHLDPSFDDGISKVFKSNRNSNPETSYFGLLKKIIYPTKGYTEIQYEPNSKNIDEIITPPPVPQEHVFIYYNSDYKGDKNESTKLYVPFTQDAKLSITVDFDYGDPKCVYDPIHNTTGGMITLKSSNGEIVASQNYTGELIYKYPHGLSEGNYELTAKLMRKCTYVSGTMYYSKTKPYPIKRNKPYAGNRVSKTIDYSENNKTGYRKKYYYADNINTLDLSSGEFATSSPDSRPNFDVFYNGAERIITMFSSSVDPLYSSEGYSLVYPSVIESLGGDNFEQGGIQHSFILNQEELPINICNPFDTGNGYTTRNTSMENSFLNGSPLSMVKFKKNKETIQYLESLKYNYTHKKNMDYRFQNYVVKHIGDIIYSSIGPGINGKIYQFMVDTYYINSQKHYLSSTISKTYDSNGLNPIETITNYFYDSPNHFQLTSQTSTTSTGELLTKYQYPPDFPTDPVLKELTLKNQISTPVTTEVIRKEDNTEKQLSFTQTEYAKEGNLVLPKFIYAKKGDAPLEKKITYTKYDDKGNLLQYTPENGIPVSIIWGYNQLYPIAKIEGIGYDEMINGGGNIKDIVEALLFNTTRYPENQEFNLNLLNQLRVNSVLKNSMVTTYTYTPLVGVTSVTSPNGLTEYYIYDSFGRLKEIKDSEGKILKSFEYHYKTQN